MVFAEAFGAERFRQRVKIYATDVDDEALAQARQASYTGAELDNLAEDQIGQTSRRRDASSDRWRIH